jgi:hypothetical protein
MVKKRIFGNIFKKWRIFAVNLQKKLKIIGHKVPTLTPGYGISLA